LVRPLRRHCERQRSNPDEGCNSLVWIASSLRSLAMTDFDSTIDHPQ
jgi:hypothetical protein